MTAPADSTTTPVETTDEVIDSTTTTETTDAPADPAAGLDDNAQKVIKAIRGDYKSEREKRQAAETRAQNIEAAIKTALGLTEAPPDPAALTAQLTEVQQAARQAQVELAVYRAAQSANINANALLDSRTFMLAIKDVDPSDTEALSAAMTAAVEANPLLAPQPTRRAPAPNPAQGSSANGAPSLHDQIAEAQKRGDYKTVISLNTQMLQAQRQGVNGL